MRARDKDYAWFSRKLVVAERGKSKSARTRARNEIRKELVRLANRANARMRRLESKGWDRSAIYQRESAWLSEERGRKRYSGKVPLDKVLSEYRHIQALLRAQQAESEEQARNLKNIAHMRANYGTLADRSDGEIDDFLKFLGTDSVSDYLRGFATSPEAVEALAEIWEVGASEQNILEDLFGEYDRFIRWRKEHPYEDAQKAPGMTWGEVREGLSQEYESVKKRRR